MKRYLQNLAKVAGCTFAPFLAPALTISPGVMAKVEFTDPLFWIALSAAILMIALNYITFKWPEVGFLCGCYEAITEHKVFQYQDIPLRLNLGLLLGGIAVSITEMLFRELAQILFYAVVMPLGLINLAVLIAMLYPWLHIYLTVKRYRGTVWYSIKNVNPVTKNTEWIQDTIRIQDLREQVVLSELKYWLDTEGLQRRKDKIFKKGGKTNG